MAVRSQAERLLEQATSDLDAGGVSSPRHDAEVLLLEDHLAASVGLGDVVSGPPDHVAFSRSVFTRFGLPRRVHPAP